MKKAKLYNIKEFTYANGRREYAPYLNFAAFFNIPLNSKGDISIFRNVASFEECEKIIKLHFAGNCKLFTKDNYYRRLTYNK
jgi:hypothetical protein